MFLLEYLKHPIKVGAVAPSGKALARKMMEPVDFAAAKVIVEYGPGTGSFTRELIARKRSDTKLILIEQNDVFFKEMYESFHGKDNIFVHHGSAEDADSLLNDLGIEGADFVVSGLPFASLPKEVSLRIFEATKKLIGRDGAFITFQYFRVNEGFFLEHFEISDRLRENLNLPPAYVYVLKNKGAQQ